MYNTILTFIGELDNLLGGGGGGTFEEFQSVGGGGELLKNLVHSISLREQALF